MQWYHESISSQGLRSKFTRKKKKDSGVNYELSECHILSTLGVNFYEVGSFLHVLFSPLSMHIEVRWTSTEDKENNNSVTLLIAACRVISLNIS